MQNSLKLDLSRTNPKQEQFFTAHNRMIMYGGARGGGKSWAVLFATAGFVCSFHHELSILKYNKANGSYFLKWMAERGSLPNILIWEKFGLIGYCLVVAAVLSIIWFIWRAWRYANKKGNVCDEVISITAFVHFALAGTYFVAEMAFPDGNYFWGNNLPFFTGTLENNLLYLAELGIVYRILRKSIGK